MAVILAPETAKQRKISIIRFGHLLKEGKFERELLVKLNPYQTSSNVYVHFLKRLIHSFIHTEHLYSASSRGLLRGAPDSSTAKKSSVIEPCYITRTERARPNVSPIQMNI